MIALLGASAITLTALQATINAPTDAFRGCLKEAVAKAKTEKVGGDAIEAYLLNACTVQMQSLKTAVIAFRTKNGMARKAAADDAEMTVEDYVASPVDNYKFMVDYEGKNKPAAPAAAPAASPTAAATPAASQQPPKG
jgi:arginine deiminase